MPKLLEYTCGISCSVCQFFIHRERWCYDGSQANKFIYCFQRFNTKLSLVLLLPLTLGFVLNFNPMCEQINTNAKTCIIFTAIKVSTKQTSPRQCLPFRRQLGFMTGVWDIPWRDNVNFFWVSVLTFVSNSVRVGIQINPSRSFMSVYSYIQLQVVISLGSTSPITKRRVNFWQTSAEGTEKQWFQVPCTPGTSLNSNFWHKAVRAGAGINSTIKSHLFDITVLDNMYTYIQTGNQWSTYI